MGAPRGEHSIQAVTSQDQESSGLVQLDLPSHSSLKGWFKCACSNSKHADHRSFRSANCSDTAMACRVCAGEGSSGKRVLHVMLDERGIVKTYSVESVSLCKPAQPVEREGVRVDVTKKKWDVTVAAPHGLLIEVQGQGHNLRLVGKANNTDSSLWHRQLKGRLYTEEAQR
jgi:hypothetical protein